MSIQRIEKQTMSFLERLIIHRGEGEPQVSSEKVVKEVSIEILTHNGITNTQGLGAGVEQIVRSLVSTQCLPSDSASFDGWVCHITLSDDEVADDEVRFLVQVSPCSEE